MGANALPLPDRRSLIRLFAGVVREPMFLLLVAAAAIYVVFGDLVEALTLGASVLVIVAITIAQERRTESALGALRDLVSPTARACRDGAWVSVDARDLVVGDLIQIVEGDRTPADARLVDGTLLSVDESLLTGESVPVVKDPHRQDLVFGGTLITAGHAIAEVVATGARSEVGQIGTSLGSIDETRAPIQREVARIVPRIAMAALALSLILVIVLGLTTGGWLAAALAGITLAMALLPEEMPVVLVVFFTLGARRIAKRGVLARRGDAVETLGEITVLCVDKTGTLTENRMSIARLVSAELDLAVDPSVAQLPEVVHQLVEFGLLACPLQPTDPMDLAFAALAHRTLARTEHVYPRWRQLREYPLASGLLAVTHAWRDDHTRTVVATKGAPEAIFDLCHFTPEAAEPWRARVARMASAGLRVLAVASATPANLEPAAIAHDYDFTIVGLVGLADPVRPGTAEMVRRCRDAGIRVIMVTGDHPETARAIAIVAGIASEPTITGAEIDALDDEALAARLAVTHVVARAVPAHKLRIVRALRASGEVVGMTGDGVNDAPALAAADIGIAMGARGSDVAREAAKLVLVDDQLGSIVDAIRTGRAIFDNILSAIGYLIAVHLPIAGIALLPPVLGWGPLLSPLHIVFLELIIDPTCSIVFEMEPPATDSMRRPPRRRGTTLFSGGRVAFHVGLGLAALAGGVGALAWASAQGLPVAALRSIAFVTLVAGNLGILIACRDQPMRGNRAAVWLIAAAVSLAGVIVAVPAIERLFGFAAPGPTMMAIAVAASLSPVLAIGALRVRRRRARSDPRRASAT